NTTFNGVRVYALDRNSMVNGGSAHAIGFSILPANLGDQYSLVPASFRTGDPPPAGQPEWFMDVNSSATAGTVETQVFVRRFHATGQFHLWCRSHALTRRNYHGEWFQGRV